ncbi:MAG: PIN domain-containing protein [Myxococcales bacterium]|nr:PIN domain-containing protein [Myxococcales bacterium]
MVATVQRPPRGWRRPDVKFLLDTHVLLRWTDDPARLLSPHRRILRAAEASGDRVGASIITLWEIAQLVERGCYEIRDSLKECIASFEAHDLIVILPIDGAIAIDSHRLGAKFPRDPVDQIIAATARCHDLTLLTADERIRDSGAVATR